MNLKTVLLILIGTCLGTVSMGQTLFSGEFEADGFFTTFEGTWEIVKLKEGTLLKFGDDFKAKKAPDLQIFLSRLNYDEIDEDNAADRKTSTLVAPLTKFKGIMEIQIPKDVNPADYKSILVHCVEYSQFWGGSDLKK